MKVEESLEKGRSDEQKRGAKLSRKRDLRFIGDFETQLGEAESLIQFVSLFLSRLARQDNALGELLEREQDKDAAVELQKQREGIRIEMKEALMTAL